jgi:hypothetical protein
VLAHSLEKLPEWRPHLREATGIKVNNIPANLSHNIIPYFPFLSSDVLDGKLEIIRESKWWLNIVCILMRNIAFSDRYVLNKGYEPGDIYMNRRRIVVNIVIFGLHVALSAFLKWMPKGLQIYFSSLLKDAFVFCWNWNVPSVSRFHFPSLNPIVYECRLCNISKIHTHCTVFSTN